MTFGSSGTGMDNSSPEVREREGNGKKPFPKFGNGKGMKKKHSQNLGITVRCSINGHALQADYID